MLKTGKSAHLGNFWKELRRRKVVRRNMVYIASAFLILELVSIIAEPFGLPGWSLKFVFIILCIGLVFSLILSWFYDFTSDGLERIKPAEEINEVPDEKSSQLIVWKVATYISIAIIIGLLVFNIAKGRNQSEQLAAVEKSIAVLPFDNLSTGEEYSHIGDAITHEIILELQKINEFRVLSRSSTMQFKETRPTITEIAAKLGVNYVIEGSIQRHVEDVSIRVQVIRSEPENHIWGEEYNGEWDDIFTIQDDIASNVARELKVVLSPFEIEQIEKRPTENLEAYNLYLRGRYYWQMQTNSSFDRATEYFEQALQQDPDFALAYTGIGLVYHQRTFHGNRPPNEAYPKIREYVEKALAFDKDLAEAHVLLGNINRLYEWDWKAAERNYKKALDLNPNLADTHMYYAYLLAFTERFAEAIESAEKAQDLDPISSWINAHVGFIYLLDGQYDRTIEESKMTLALDPDSWIAHHILGSAFAGKFMNDEAIVEFEKAVEISGGNSFALATLASTCYEADQIERADEIFMDLKRKANDEYIPPMCFCWIHQARGEMDLYYEWLEIACNERDGYIPWYMVHPVDIYRIPDEPRAREILMEAGLLN